MSITVSGLATFPEALYYPVNDTSIRRGYTGRTVSEVFLEVVAA